ncbi:MAG: DNA-3-methyladenine glycosylase 2 family protein [Rhodospirillales bacterium]|nr:DNA-3-methyladenine glycosylase 2 family protein [Rhodospirillales bacterium]MBO6786390.1 DNA-3-methyladenine glycosylase 2 family protein [Rhodospirillales bacterium]
MRDAVQLYGNPRSRKREPGFATLVRIIIDQQVSVQAGAAIWRRLEAAAGIVEPASVNALGEQGLREAGLSGPKARYVLGIAEAVAAGELDLARLGRCREETVFRELTKLKGIGRWTAEIYMMFAMGRPDILPVGDIALQSSAGRLLELSERPGADELEVIGERWRPYRSVAAIMLWHFYKKMPAER